MFTACGDCHLMNFGGFATPERNLAFDINDFDETLPAPFEWDVKRLAASFVIAARWRGFRPDQAREIAVQAVASYRESMRKRAGTGVLEAWYSRITLDDMREFGRQRCRLERARKEEDCGSAQANPRTRHPKAHYAVQGSSAHRRPAAAALSRRLRERTNAHRSLLQAVSRNSRGGASHAVRSFQSDRRSA